MPSVWIILYSLQPPNLIGHKFSVANGLQDSATVSTVVKKSNCLPSIRPPINISLQCSIPKMIQGVIHLMRVFNYFNKIGPWSGLITAFLYILNHLQYLTSSILNQWHLFPFIIVPTLLHVYLISVSVALKQLLINQKPLKCWYATFHVKETKITPSSQVHIGSSPLN